MGLSNPINVFGIHSVVPRKRADGMPYGILKVLKDSSVSLSGELIDLSGGSNPYPWASEQGKITSEMSLKFNEYPNFVFELFLGKAVSYNSAETSGNASTLTNKKGTSLVQASTGVASVAVLTGSEANLKFSKYAVIVVSATTVNVYGMSDADYTRGTDVAYQNDALKLLAADLTITSGADTNVASLGIKFVGGSGTIGMTVGDTATFETRPVNSQSMVIDVGNASDVTPEFSAVIMAQKLGSDELFEIEAYRCKAVGLPIGFAEKAWAEVEAKAKLLYDSALGKVFTIRHVRV